MSSSQILFCICMICSEETSVSLVIVSCNFIDALKKQTKNELQQ